MKQKPRQTLLRTYQLDRLCNMHSSGMENLDIKPFMKCLDIQKETMRR